MLEKIVSNAPIYLLCAVRCFALLMTMPLFSTRAVSRVAKVALAGTMAFCLLPQALVLGSGGSSGYAGVYAAWLSREGGFATEYVFLLLGEALIGAILGFFVSVIFAAFSTAGQLFAFQIGFSAAEVYDALSQVENPLMGQFLNLVAMLVFLQSSGLQVLFLGALKNSFLSLNAISIVNNTDTLAFFMMSSLSKLFFNAFIIALPIMATLFLINVTMGILAKAAPQMNLLSEGFPLMLLTTFVILLVLLPVLCEYFEAGFNSGFKAISALFRQIAGGALRGGSLTGGAKL